MDQAIEMNIGGLKCDAPSCDYNDMSIKVEDYEQWIDAPCPKCGASLLTQKDYDHVQLLLQVVKHMNATHPAPVEDEQLYNLEVEMRGKGIEDMKVRKSNIQ